MDLLSNLHKKGITAVLLPDGRIKLSPKDKITDDLREQIKRHREEIKKELIKNMSHEELCQTITEELRNYGGRGMLVKLNVVDDEVALTTPKHFEELKKEGYIVYLPEEIISLLIATPNTQTLKTIHEIKAVFDGKVYSAHAEYMEGKCKNNL
ncbi:MAG: hypothetical protein U9N18_01995 [Campylobacterota bacterium]|nr:hypothetical protein [Campylobacterota bacterium]